MSFARLFVASRHWRPGAPHVVVVEADGEHSRLLSSFNPAARLLAFLSAGRLSGRFEAFHSPAAEDVTAALLADFSSRASYGGRRLCALDAFGSLIAMPYVELVGRVLEFDLRTGKRVRYAGICLGDQVVGPWGDRGTVTGFHAAYVHYELASGEGRAATRGGVRRVAVARGA